MTRYERRQVVVDSGPFAVAGRVVAVLGSPSANARTVRVLVSIPDESPSTGEASEGVTPETGDPTTHFCTGERGDGGRCEREVDEPGGRCWQHPEADE